MPQSNVKTFISTGTGPSIDKEGNTIRQITFGDTDLQEYEFSQWQGLEYLYEVEPQSQNLFYAGYFCEAGTGDNYGSLKMFYNAAFRIKKVSIPFPSIDIEYHPETRAPLPRDVKYQNEISIDWFEDVYHSVQKYHLDWFNRWYTREFDCFRCGIGGKFRKVAIVAFHYVNNNENSIIPVPKIQPIMAFIIGGMIPKQMPSIDFDYGSDQNDRLINMTYHCGPIRWLYSSSIGQGDSGIKHDVINKTDFVGRTRDLKDFMKNDDESFEINNQDWEKFRIVRAATYYQASEASI